jgi:hypothetical protein
LISSAVLSSIMFDLRPASVFLYRYDGTSSGI